MPVPAQPAIDSLEAALKTLEGELAAIKAEKVALEQQAASNEAENAVLKQQVADGVLTDTQATKMKALQDMAAGLGK